MHDDVLRLIVRRMFDGAPGALASVNRLSEVVTERTISCDPLGFVAAQIVHARCADHRKALRQQ